MNKSKFKRSTVGVSIFSFIIACMLWLYVMSLEDSDYVMPFTGLPVTLSGVETLEGRSLAVIDGAFTTVSVNLKGKRTDLARIKKEDISVIADVSSFRTSNNYNVAYAIVLPEFARSLVSISSFTPQSIGLFIDKQEFRTVPVKVTFDSSIAGDYIAENPEANPSTVRISGPATELARIDHAEVKLILPSEINKTFSAPLSYKLVDEGGNEVTSNFLQRETDEVLVTLPVRMSKSLRIQPELVQTEGILPENISWEAEPPNLLVSGDPDLLSEINSISVGPINLKSVRGNTFTESYTVVLPNGIINETGVSAVTVEITISGVVTRQIETGNIQIINASPPEGYTVAAITEAMTITLRGAPDDIERIQPSDVRITVDMSQINQAPGQTSVEAVVDVINHSEIGVVGDYKATIAIIREEEALQ